MKKVGDLMQDLGFNPDASQSSKEAFIRHLVKAATGVDLGPGPTERALARSRRGPLPQAQEEQLSFDFFQIEAGPRESGPRESSEIKKRTG
jgi:hypothetical protein